MECKERACFSLLREVIAHTQFARAFSTFSQELTPYPTCGGRSASPECIFYAISAHKSVVFFNVHFQLLPHFSACPKGARFFCMFECGQSDM
jgi:hypothetical protein